VLGSGAGWHIGNGRTCLSDVYGTVPLVALPQEVLDLEIRSVGDHGEPTLGLALRRCVALWEGGQRDRELRLHLIFLAWYCNLEPPHLTGAEISAFADDALGRLFFEVFQTFEETIADDPECLYVIGLMASLAPYLLGDTEAAWELRAKSYQTRYRELLPQGLDSEVFAGRGAYGTYFSGQVVVRGGF
jgi:hypothetical protein